MRQIKPKRFDNAPPICPYFHSRFLSYWCCYFCSTEKKRQRFPARNSSLLCSRRKFLCRTYSTKTELQIVVGYHNTIASYHCIQLPTKVELVSVASHQHDKLFSVYYQFIHYKSCLFFVLFTQFNRTLDFGNYFPYKHG